MLGAVLRIVFKHDRIRNTGFRRRNKARVVILVSPAPAAFLHAIVIPRVEADEADLRDVGGGLVAGQDEGGEFRPGRRRGVGQFPLDGEAGAFALQQACLLDYKADRDGQEGSG